MSVINQFVYKNIKLNYKRSIATIIGILLSVSMVCCISVFGTSFYETILQQEIIDTGYFHIKLDHLDNNQLETAKANIKFDDTIIHNIGYGKIESKDESKVYSHLVSLNNKDDFYEFGFDLLEGSYPTNANEILISKHIEYHGGMDNYKIGDTITLSAGKRVIDGYDLNYFNPYDLSEEVIDSEQYEFEIVGMIDRPSYFFENYGNPGYSFITTGIQSDCFDLYMTSKSISTLYEDINNLLQTDDYNYESSDLYSFDTNHSLIRIEKIDLNNRTMIAVWNLILFVVCIIVFVSVYCIKNAFSISYSEKTKMMSMMKSIGCTNKQIKSILFKEANLFSLIAIPLGVLGGLFASYILIQFVSVYMVKHGLPTVFYHINWFVILFTCIVGYITVALSVLHVMRLATKVSPIENIKNSDQIRIKTNKLKVPKVITKLFGIGGDLAYKNLQRSKRKYRTTVYSIATCIFVFITMNSFVTVLEQSAASYYQSNGANIAVRTTSSDTIYTTDVVELLEDEDYTFISKLIFDLIEFDENYVAPSNNDSKRNVNLAMIMLMHDKEFDQYVKEFNQSNINVVLQDTVYDQTFYRSTLYNESNNVQGIIELENEIVMNFDESIDVITRTLPKGLSNYDYSLPQLIIRYDYFMEQYDFNEDTLFNECFYVFTDDAYTLSPILQDYFNEHFNDVWVTNYQQLIDENNDFILMLSVFLYGFIAVISCIGITNIFNTIYSNITLRKREFASLQSIGMTSKQFNQMLNLETLFYCSKALFVGISTGLMGNFIVNKIVNDAIYLDFYYPTMPIITCVIGVLVLVYVIMRYSLKIAKKDSIIDTIRNVNI